MKKPFQVGDKIKFVGPFMEAGSLKAAYSRGISETVREYDDETEKVTLESGAVIHRRQVTHRIKKKAPPAERERVTAGGETDGSFFILHCVGIKRGGVEKKLQSHDFLPGKEKRGVHLKEVRPGEILLDRAGLEKAWLKAGLAEPESVKSQMKYDAFFKALGLGEKP